MAWSLLPVAADSAILKTQFDELRAAIVERNVAAGSPITAPAAVSANGDQAASVLTNYRAAIDNLIPYYANADGSYEALDKGTCLTAAIGAANWEAAGDTKMYTGQLNDMRLVLNELTWVRLTASWDDSTGQTGTGESNTSWADAWNNTLNEWAAATPGAPTQAGWETSAMSPGGSLTYSKTASDYAAADISFVVANYTVADAKVEYVKTSLAGTVALDFHQAADYSGSATAISITAGATVVIDVTNPTKNATAHYSCRNNPDPVAMSTHDPGDSDGAAKGGYASDFVLIVQHTFTYAG